MQRCLVKKLKLTGLIFFHKFQSFSLNSSSEASSVNASKDGQKKLRGFFRQFCIFEGRLKSGLENSHNMDSLNLEINLVRNQNSNPLVQGRFSIKTLN